MACVHPAVAAPSGGADDGIVRIGIYQNAPKVFLDESGRPAGLFADIIAGLAEEFDWDVRYVRCNWSECLEKLAAGEIDVMPDVAHSQARAEAFQFGRVPVLHSWSYLYSSPGSVAQSLADLQGKRVAVLEDSIQHQRLREIRTARDWTFELVEAGNHAQTMALVAQGDADIGIVNHFFGEALEPRFDLIRSQIPFQPTGLYFGFAPSFDPDRIDLIDAKIVDLKSNPDSVYFESYDRWLAPARAAAVPEWLYWLAGAAVLILLVSFGAAALLKRQVSHATAALHRSQNKLIEAQYLARVGDFTWDLRSDEVYWSDGMRKLLGYSADDPVSFDLIAHSVHHPADGPWVMRWLQDGIEAGATTLGPETYRLCRKDGEAIYVESNVRIERRRGAAVRVFGTCHDITQQVMAEAALQAAKRDAEEAARVKSDFLASMSHELRTPLNAILGFTEVLCSTAGSNLSETQRRQLENVRAAGQQLLILVDDILDLSSIESDRIRIALEPVVVNDIVADSVDQIAPLAARSGITIDNRLAAAAPARVTADPARLQQVLLNLLTNAVKYNRERGHIAISAEAREDGYLRLSVADTGCGVPRHKRDEIFDLFSRLDGDAMVAGGGTGIGLTVAKRLVERMDGRIGLESREGVGSTFWCDLPLSVETAAAASG